MGGGPIKQRYGYEDDYRMRQAALGMDFDTTGYMPDALELAALTVEKAKREAIDRSQRENYVAEVASQEGFCEGMQWTPEQLKRLKEENGNDPRGEE